MAKYGLLAAMALALVSSMTGCMTPPPADFHFSVAPVEHQPKGNIPLRVGLVLSDEFKDATWIQKEHGITYHIGPVFSEKAEEASKSVFKEVVIIDDEQALGDIDAALIPQLVSFERSRPVFGTQDSISTAILRWRMTDTRHSLVWIDTVTVEAISSMTTGEATQAVMTMDPFGAGKASVDRAMDILARRFFEKSIMAMTSSVEIKAFARKAVESKN